MGSRFCFLVQFNSLPSTPRKQREERPNPWPPKGPATLNQKVLWMGTSSRPLLNSELRKKLPPICSVAWGWEVKAPLPSHTRQPGLHSLSSSSSETLAPYPLASFPPFPEAQYDLSQTTKHCHANSPPRTLPHPRGRFLGPFLASPSEDAVGESGSGGQSERDKERERYRGHSDINTWIIAYI